MTDVVLVVEDTDFTRMLLVTAVQTLGYEVHGAADAADAMRCARTTGKNAEPTMALIDLDLGDGPTGADLARGLRRMFPSIGLAILSSYEDPRLLGNLPDFPPGTCYLTKSHVGDIDALAAVIAECTANPTAPRTFAHALDLSDGQLEVMRLVALGCSNTEIAKTLWLSVSAVEKSIHRLAQQLALPVTATANRRVLIAQAYYRHTMSDQRQETGVTQIDTPTPDDAP